MVSKSWFSISAPSVPFKFLIYLLLALPLFLICKVGDSKISTAQAPPPVVINEIQYHPRSDDHGEEYIELYNADTLTVSLDSWTFSDGIDYTFPASATIPPGGYLVVGHDPTTVEATYGISGVFGPFAGKRLANSGERVALSDGMEQLVDVVSYDDHPPWPELPDGKGPSLELINPTFDNNSPCSWSASTGLGTPGVRNSSYLTGNIPPCITQIEHSPVFPAAGQSTLVSANISDNDTVVTATLHYRLEGTPTYTTLTMTPNGASYSADVPPQPNGLYVEFYLTATDDEEATRTVPDGAPGTTSSETGLPVTISYLYLIEDTPPSASLSLYRLLMTKENQAELTTRDLFSNELLDATFVYGSEVFYNVGVRYRGESTRNFSPRPYRIKFRDEHEFEDRERINLVSDEMGREALAHDLFRRVGHLAPDTQFVTLYVNEAFEGDYLSIEQVDNDFLDIHLPDDDGGNLYRGKDGGDLSYRGPNPDSYRPYYLKENNYESDDYADIIALTDALTNSPDETFRTQAEAVADMDQWLRWFAVQAVLDNHEGALWIGPGDDYFLYHRPSDDRFILISWDHDFTFAYPNHGIWEPNWYAGEIVQRILNYPVFTRWYYRNIANIAANEFSISNMFPLIDALPSVVSEQKKNELRSFVADRIPKLNSEIPKTTLSISTNGGADFSTHHPEVTLEGNCSPLRDVYVNGDPSRIQYPTATTWRYTRTLWTRDNTFVITDGLHSRTITVYWDYFYGGALSEDTTLWTSRRPYLVNENITVPAGVTLTVEPGVTLQFQMDRYIRVNEGGRLLAEGAPTQPIVFTRQGSDYWGGILLDRTQEDNRIRHAVVEYTREVIDHPRTHGVSAYGARVSIADSEFRYTDASVAVLTYPWGGYNPSISLLRNHIHHIESDAVHVSYGYALIQGNYIHDIQHGEWPVEGIEVSHMDVSTPTILLDNHIHDVYDDCLDLNHSSAIIERNQLHHCEDKGITIGHPSSTTLINNLIYACAGKDADPYSGTGIAIKDGAISYIANTTVSDCRRGIYLYEGHEGEGGGTAEVVNSVVWGNEQNLALDALSTITITYSDIYTTTGIGTAIWSGEGNINQDPLFRSPQNGIYRLRENSPCIDTGTAERAPDEDVLGIYRPHGEGYDMGAHEFFEYFSIHLPLVLRSH